MRGVGGQTSCQATVVDSHQIRHNVEGIRKEQTKIIHSAVHSAFPLNIIPYPIIIIIISHPGMANVGQFTVLPGIEDVHQFTNPRGHGGSQQKRSQTGEEARDSFLFVERQEGIQHSAVLGFASYELDHAPQGDHAEGVCDDGGAALSDHLLGGDHTEQG